VRSLVRTCSVCVHSYLLYLMEEVRQQIFHHMRNTYACACDCVCVCVCLSQAFSLSLCPSLSPFLTLSLSFSLSLSLYCVTRVCSHFFLQGIPLKTYCIVCNQPKMMLVTGNVTRACVCVFLSLSLPLSLSPSLPLSLIPSLPLSLSLSLSLSAKDSASHGRRNAAV